MTLTEFIRGVYQGNVSTETLVEIATYDFCWWLEKYTPSRWWDQDALGDWDLYREHLIEAECNDGCSGAPQDCSRCPLVQYMEFTREDKYTLAGYL